GGWWVDLDTICLKPLDFIDDFVFFSGKTLPYHRYAVNESVIKSMPQAKFLKDCLEYTDRNQSKMWSSSDEFGAMLLSRMIFLNDLENKINSAAVICNMFEPDPGKFSKNIEDALSVNFYVLHLQQSVWKRHNKNLYHTFFDKLYKTLVSRAFLREQTLVVPSKQDEILAADLTDTTFVIAFTIELDEQLEALLIVLDYFEKYFRTNVILIEMGRAKKLKFLKYQNIKVSHHFRYNDSPELQEHFYINEMIKSAETPFVGIWNPHAIVPPQQILRAVGYIRHCQVTMCFPYNKNIFYVDDILGYLFRLTLDCNYFKKNISNMYRSKKIFNFGTPFFVVKDKFVKYGMINELIMDREKEMLERVRRVKLQGGVVSVVEGEQYALNKPVNNQKETFYKKNDPWKLFKE
ncbi:MAG TPA: hypothetical protein VIH57_25910, partial [Bacteroidales bacterium]